MTAHNVLEASAPLGPEDAIDAAAKLSSSLICASGSKGGGAGSGPSRENCGKALRGAGGFNAAALRAGGRPAYSAKQRHTGTI